jgi:hypothetical protein
MRRSVSVAALFERQIASGPHGVVVDDRPTDTGRIARVRRGLDPGKSERKLVASRMNVERSRSDPYDARRASAEEPRRIAMSEYSQSFGTQWNAINGRGSTRSATTQAILI